MTNKRMKIYNKNITKFCLITFIVLTLIMVFVNDNIQDFIVSELILLFSTVSSWALHLDYNNNNNRVIVCSAIRLQLDPDNELIVKGVRHADCYRELKRQDIKASNYSYVEGFVDNYGKFLPRTSALSVARDAMQVRNTKGKSELYSEDLY